VCGFETRLGNTLIGVDAAHVKWHRAGGPDEVTNGLALCALHHRLFDRGAYTLRAISERERVVEVAEEAHGGTGFEHWLLAFHGRPIEPPISDTYRVSDPSIVWHSREVFRGPARR
jgi:putative restriction endonuclease